MERNKKSQERINVEEIINTIIEEISRKHVCSDLEIQKYKERLSSFLYKLLETFDERNEFSFKIIGDPHEYAKAVKGIEARMIQYNGYECEEEEIFVENIAGKVNIISDRYSNFKKVDFSLLDVQIRVMAQNIYSGKVRAFDFERMYKRKGIYKILVYIPRERDEKENSVKTYQELVQKEEKQKIEDKIEENKQEIIYKIMSEIEESYELNDNLKNEYIEKIQEFLKLKDPRIESILKSWRREYNFKLTIKRDPYEYAEQFKYYYERYLLSKVIGDCNCSQEMEKIDFLLGNIQICMKVKESYGEFNPELLVYIPEKEFFEKKGIETYRELIENDKNENEIRIQELAENSRNNLSERLKFETSGKLTQEQIENILSGIDFIYFIELCDMWNDFEDSNNEYNYGLSLTSNPDEFSKYIEIAYNTIMGDSIKRRIL